MDSMKSRPHAAVHTGAHISLLRCTRQASTRVVTNKQEKTLIQVLGCKCKIVFILEFTVCSKLD